MLSGSSFDIFDVFPQNSLVYVSAIACPLPKDSVKSITMGSD
jgi:hypothetical protein